MGVMESIQYYNLLAVRAVHDAQAFSELYDVYFPRVYNFLFGRCKNAAMADDLVSECFEKMFVKLDQYNPAKAAFSTWLFRIASNTLTDAYRRNHNAAVDFEDIAPTLRTEQTPEHLAIAGEEASELLAAVSQLKERERRFIALRYWSGLSNQEIAELEGVSAGNVATILHRALASLKLILEKMQ